MASLILFTSALLLLIAAGLILNLKSKTVSSRFCLVVALAVFLLGTHQGYNFVQSYLYGQYEWIEVVLIFIISILLCWGANSYRLSLHVIQPNPPISTEDHLSFFSTLIDTIPIPIFYKGTDGRYQGCNKAFEAYTGKTKEQLVGSGVFDIASSELAKTYKEKDDILFTEPGIQHYEAKFKHADGNIRDILFSKATYFKSDGSIGGLVGTMRDVTEQKKNEGEILYKEQTIRSILNAAPIGIGVVKNRILGWTNERFQIITGYSAEELEGQSARILYPSEEEFLRVGREKHPQIHTKGVGSIETRLKRKDGTIIDVFLRSAEMNPNRFENSLIFTALDITEQKRTRDLLENERKLVLDVASTNNLTEITERVLETICQLEEIDCGAVYIWNDKHEMLELIFHEGVSTDFVKSVYWLEQDNPFLMLIKNGSFCGKLPEEIRTIPFMKKENIQSSVAIPIIHKSKHLLVLIAASHTVENISENTCHTIQALATHISGAILRAKHANDLRESRDLLKGIFEAIQDLILVLDRDFRIVHSNAKSNAFSNDEYDSDRLTCYEYLMDHDAPCDDCHLNDLFQTGNPLLREQKVYQDGSIKEISACPIFDEHGHVQYVVEHIHDITEEKKMEEKIQQSQKMEAIGQLAGGVAHDFNNMLMAIDGYCNFAMQTLPSDDPIQDDLHEILNASERAANLTRQLLAFSRRQILQPMVLDINDLINQFDKMLRRLIREDIEFIVIFESNVRMVHADPGHLEQVIMNLVVNAKDAMPHGGKLTLETRNIFLDEKNAEQYKLDPGPYVMISLSDTGMGMSKEIQDKIFEPFFTTKSVGEGTGLGLSTVFGIVKQSKGHISVYSEPEIGTTFNVYLPAVDGHMVESREKTQNGEIKGSETILVVEDDNSVRNVICRTLESAGYHVLEAANGDEAIYLCKNQEQSIHLMLSDVVMPNMSGRQLSQHIRKMLPELKIVFMSGYTDNAIVHHGVLDKNVNFIHKPFHSYDLMIKIREILDHQE